MPCAALIDPNALLTVAEQPSFTRAHVNGRANGRSLATSTAVTQRLYEKR